MPVTRKLDERRRNSRFIQLMRLRLRRQPGSLGVVTESVEPRSFRTYDARTGVLVATSFSDCLKYREKAERILGGPVYTIYADSSGTIYGKAD